MKTIRRFASRVCLSGLAFFCASQSPGFGAAPNLLEPQDGAVVQLAPDAQKTYKSPKERGLDAKYSPNEAKNGVDDCSRPNPTIFRWNGEATDVEFTLQLAKTDDFVDAKEFPGVGNREREVKNLPPNTKFFWRVKATSKDGTSEFSATRSFRTEPTCPRWYDAPGVSNVRDAGGWTTRDGKRVKSGKIYRGSEFDGHFNLTEEGKRVILDEMGVVVDFDLRGAGEWGNKPDYKSPLGEPNVRRVNFPVSSYAGIFNDDQKKIYREMFQFLADEKNYPLYVHCWGGADRTGTLIMAINAILGVPDDDLFVDYELTSFSVFGERSIRSDYFQETLKELNAYGAENDSLSVKFENYLKSAGVTDDELEAIRRILLEN